MDYEKVFGRQKLFKIVLNNGYLQSLYDINAYIKISGGERKIAIIQGVRQGCPL